jgi:hypothetical protein
MADGIHAPLHFKTRIQTVPLAGDKARNCAAAEKLSINIHAVEKWRGRRGGRPRRPEAAGNALSDSPGSRRRPRITDEQEARIIALSLEDPKALGLPSVRWPAEPLRQ